ncbi:hypothetical protein BDW72DRAFT_32155 [Aspergillus terricola var. indicus]
MKPHDALDIPIPSIIIPPLPSFTLSLPLPSIQPPNFITFALSLHQTGYVTLICLTLALTRLSRLSPRSDFTSTPRSASKGGANPSSIPPKDCRQP